MRAPLLAGGLCLATLLSVGGTPLLAHVGHGDEFQQEGDVRQVKADADTDALLGITTERPQAGDGGALTVASAAVVDADGKSLVFVKSATTYDPVFVSTGATRGERIEILDGVSADEDIVVEGALSLYAESKKTQTAEATAPAADGAEKETASAGGIPPLGLAGGAAALVVVGVFAATRLKRRS